MALKKGQQIEVEISNVAFGGKGLVHVDGMVVFVEHAVPQDRVIARIIKKKKSFAEARTVELLKASPQRVKAPCVYSGFCGGCKWQFVDYAYQLAYKQQHVREALEHIAQIQNVPVHPTISSDKPFGYRNKMEFSCATRRWLLPAELGCEGIDKGMAVGLHVPGTFDKVLDVDQCLLQPDLGNRLLSEIRQYIKASPLPVYGLRTHQGFWRFVVLRHSVAYNQWMVNLVTATDEHDYLLPLAETLIQKYPEVVSVMNNITARKAAVAIGESEICLAGQAFLRECIGSFEFKLSANSFFQTNTLGAQHLYDTVKTFAGLTGQETVVDLYCGAGTISLYLASQAKAILGMEMVESAIRDAQHNCERNEIDNCHFIAGDIRYTLSQLEQCPDVMIIDPPRSGMHADVVKQVMALGPRKIVYVSCNPATQARDLALLKALYDVVEVQPVDMFPHTYHIEAVARLVRRL